MNENSLTLNYASKHKKKKPKIKEEYQVKGDYIIKGKRC